MVQLIYQDDVEIGGHNRHAEVSCIKLWHDCEWVGLYILGSPSWSTYQHAGGKGQGPVIQASCLVNSGAGLWFHQGERGIIGTCGLTRT